MQGHGRRRSRKFPHTNNAKRSTGCFVLWLAVAGLAGLVTPSTAFELDARQASSGDTHVLSDEAKGPPALWFACDGAASDVQQTLSQPAVLSDLQQLKAGVSLALPELNEGRAQIVLKLNRAGIPVTAWLALPGEQGYYLNASNAQEARTRFKEFERWSAAYGLRWAGIGLDIEPNIQDFQALGKGHKWRVVSMIIRRYFSAGRVKHARESYAELIHEMHSDGYTVETYQFPFIADERDAHSTLLERITGIVDVRADREALMLYTSFNAALDSALIWVYGPEAQAIAVGSTQGSDADPRFHPLNWEEFSRDLLVAHHFSNVIGVYNLEGCVRQGFLLRLKSMNWEEPVVIPAEAVRKAKRLRVRIQAAIWFVSHLPYLFAGALLGVVLIIWSIGRRRKAKRRAVQHQPEQA
jgi:hypothetical protein